MKILERSIVARIVVAFLFSLGVIAVCSIVIIIVWFIGEWLVDYTSDFVAICFFVFLLAAAMTARFVNEDWS